MILYQSLLVKILKYGHHNLIVQVIYFNDIIVPVTINQISPPFSIAVYETTHHAQMEQYLNHQPKQYY